MQTFKTQTDKEDIRMRLKIFTVYDSKAQAYMQPFYMQSTGQAVRSFDDTVNDHQHPFSKHPEDYTLFELGEYDDQSATFSMHEAKKSIGTAQEFVRQNEMPLEQPQLKGVQ